MLTRLLFKIARSRVSSFFVGFIFEHLSRLIPLERAYENRQVVVFAHPLPTWSLHLLAVPKKRIPSFMQLALDTIRHQQVVLSIFQAIKSVSCQKELSNFMVIVNGGAYQDVPQIHFHIACQCTKGNRLPGTERVPWDRLDLTRAERFPSEATLAFPHPNPARQFHYVVMAANAIPGLTGLDLTNAAHTRSLLALLCAAQTLITMHKLSAYMLVLNFTETNPDPRLLFHILSGSDT